MKKVTVLGIAVLSAAMTGCKSDDAKLKELTQQSETVNREIQSDCFATSSTADGGGMFASPGSEKAKAWRRDEQAREARQAALDQSPHCKELKQKQVQLAGQIADVNNKVMWKELKKKTLNQ